VTVLRGSKIAIAIFSKESPFGSPVVIPVASVER
jgi:hypothetical protein